MSYLMDLKRWMDHTTSTYRDLLPSGFSSTFAPSMSYNYASDTSANNALEQRMYMAALSLYTHILGKLERPSESKSSLGAYYHWVPVENPYCTQLIDLESGRRVTVSKSRDGMSLSGYHSDIETNFGRSMGAEAAKMMYDNRLHDETREQHK